MNLLLIEQKLDSIEQKFDKIDNHFDKIETQIDLINRNLAEHMSRTAASEARLDVMEKFVIEQVTNSSKMYEKSLNFTIKTVKISVGVFGLLVGIITAFATFFN